MRNRIAGIFTLILLPLSSQAAEKAWLLPTLETTAAGAALGDGGAFLSGLDALGVNPAGLAGSKREVNTGYQQLPAETNVGSVGLALPLRGWTVGASYLALRSEGLEGRDGSGQSTGHFTHQDQIAALHFAKSFGSWTGGVSAKALHSRILSYEGTGYAADFGARMTLPNQPLTLSVAALNLGKGPALAGTAARLPTQYNLSGSYQAIKALNILGGVGYTANEKKTKLNMGVQYDLAQVLTLRGRYALAGTGAKGMEGFAGGIGLRFAGQSVDYVFQPFDQALDEAGLSGSHRATLTVRF